MKLNLLYDLNDYVTENDFIDLVKEYNGLSNES